MKVKGEIGVEIKEDVYYGEDKPRADGKQHWYDRIRWGDLDIPYCTRPKGKGVRVDFYAFANLYDKALEIKEAAPWAFKHTGDVNRNAHYIGMYVLEQLHVVLKNHVMEERISLKMRDTQKMLEKQESLRAVFQKFFDKHVQGLIDRKGIMGIVEEIAIEIPDPDLKEWFEDDCDDYMRNEGNYIRSKDKSRKKEARLKGIELVGE